MQIMTFWDGSLKIEQKPSQTATQIYCVGHPNFRGLGEENLNQAPMHKQHALATLGSKGIHSGH